VLASNPSSNRTEDPLAIVCDFAGRISDDVLRETLRLGWSFSRSPMLVTVEPTLLRAWTCWKRPVKAEERVRKLRVEELRGDLFDGASLSEQAARALHWVELASGSFFRNPKYSRYFQRNQRADHLMLEDLKGLRRRLLGKELSQDICHDLIARTIFIEFLFQRKDSQGNAALDDGVLRNLRTKGVLLRDHEDLGSILESRGETYRFFRELNDRFNGDLFPGKGETPEEREEEWKAEMRQVRADPHLKLLAEFVRGKMEITTGQLCLWKRYAFDVIPLEFISSIYEEFVKAGGKESSGVHYTPGHVVDFMLDEVLPWKSKKWDLKILDPACGSGIFLVKAYQRLVHRWKEAHPDTPKVGDLRQLLEDNLFGVDTQGDAVRVASFSLYLAMCDEIEPKHVWERQVKFPRLRDRTLIESDFFADDQEGFRTEEDKNSYDLLIGNPPWGQDEATDLAESWAKRDPADIWPIQYKSPGPLFLIKGGLLTKSNGYVSMIQPAQALLTNRQSKAIAFRRKFFSRFKVDEIVNLSALRFGLFKDSISPACIVKLRPQRPDSEPFTYVCPKPTRSKEDQYLIVVEPHDVHEIFPHEAANESEVWSALMWGGRRDLAVVRRLKREQNIGGLSDQKKFCKRQGVIRGDLKRTEEKIIGRRMLETNAEPRGSFLFLDAEQLPINKDGSVHSRESTDISAFEVPQLILKQSWKSGGRFQAFLVRPDKSGEGIVCSGSYVSVHVEKKDEIKLEGACLSYNSILGVYYLFLTSGRCSGFIPEACVEEIMSVPIPKPKKGILQGLKRFEDVDERVREAFGFRDAEWVLVEDLSTYTLQDFKGDRNSPGRQPTQSLDSANGIEENERLLRGYCDYFRRVLRAGFGDENKVSATIFTEDGGELLPVRLVGIHLGSGAGTRTRLEAIDSPDLIERLKRLDERFLKLVSDPENGGIFYRRVARIYDRMRIEGKDVPTIFIVKPDQVSNNI